MTPADAAQNLKETVHAHVERAISRGREMAEGIQTQADKMAENVFKVPATDAGKDASSAEEVTHTCTPGGACTCNDFGCRCGWSGGQVTA